LIHHVVSTLTEGMLFDLAFFGSADPTAVKTFAELDRYTYLIAGVVGEFWTDLAVAVGVWKEERRAELAALGIRFGKGLQLVNILRDIRADLRNRGRVYLPAAELAAAGLTPGDLTQAGAFAAFRPLYGRYIGLAQSHFRAAQRYILAVPRRRLRLRLACIWPLWIGLATLRALSACPNILTAPPVRIPQRETYRLLGLSLLCAPSNRLLETVFRSLVRQAGGPA
jgi:farnesyl-diphosphate farnesyltransferase